ncbi:MAG: transcriptional regulator [Firmicutes bacterium]|nr:transcriptional regulator [Bacillota bacterium]
MEVTQGLSRQLEEAIRRSNTVIYRRGRSILAEMGISNPQFNALLTLNEFGPLTMGELCKHLLTACSTATDLADRLERDGLVERVRDSKDRRIVRMHMLSKGEDVVELVISERRRFLDKVLLEFKSEEQAQALESFELLADRMECLDKDHPVQFVEVKDIKKRVNF